MNAGTAADLIVLIHFLYVLFTVLGEVFILAGGLLKWQWVRRRLFRLVHAGAVLLVAFESLLGIFCPLTTLEYSLREKAGQNTDTSMSFTARLIHKIIFYDLPDSFFLILYLSFGALVILSFFLVPVNWREKKF